MERTKFSTDNSVKYPDIESRISVCHINPEKHPHKFLRKRYGDTRLKTWGELPEHGNILRERAMVTFATFLKMVNSEPGRIIECSVKDVLRARGHKDVHDKETLHELREDIKQLLNIKVRYSNNGKGKWKDFYFCSSLIDGAINYEDDTVRVWISPALDDMMVLGFFNMDFDVYSKFRSPITRQLYRLFMSQRFIHQEGGKYPIGLEKLCHIIGWYVKDQSWAWVRQVLKNKFSELKMIKDHEFDPKSKEVGGTVTVYSAHVGKASAKLARNSTKQLTGHTQDVRPHQEAINGIKKLLQEYKKDWSEADEAKLSEQLNVLQPCLKTKGKELSSVVQDYCKWLIGGKCSKIKWYAHQLFDPENLLFKRFEKWLDNKDSAENKSQPRAERSKKKIIDEKQWARDMGFESEVEDDGEWAGKFGNGRMTESKYWENHAP